jgi:exosome complex RNA-binding protein Csl4
MTITKNTMHIKNTTTKCKHEKLGKRKSLHSPRDNNEEKRTCTKPHDQATQKV